MNHDTLLKELEDLDIDYFGTTDFGEYKIEVQPDDMPMNPRVDFDNLGKMVCWHSRYNLGDEHSYSDSDALFHDLSGLYEDELTDYLEPEQLDRCIAKAYDKYIILPLFLYDHSGITMRTSPFSCPWDSGCVGYVFVSKAAVRKEWGWKLITKKRREHIVNVLVSEVELYDHYLTGNVFSYTITKGEDETDVDSCCGYFGYSTDDEGYMVSVIKDAIKYDIEHTPQQIEMF